MATELLVIMLFSISLILFGCVLRASGLSGKRRIEDWNWKTSWACFFIDSAGFVLLVAIGASALILPFALIVPDIELLWLAPVLMLLVADTVTVFLLKESAQLRKRHA